jgi:hypothetical protein
MTSLTNFTEQDFSCDHESFHSLSCFNVDAVYAYADRCLCRVMTGIATFQPDIDIWSAASLLQNIYASRAPQPAIVAYSQ